jgi:uncharacterized protein (DUF885 family)
MLVVFPSLEILPMRRTAVSLLILAAGLMAASSACRAQTPTAAKPSAPAAAVEPAWVVRSNQYTQMLLDVQVKHSPDSGMAQGLAKYDSSITDPARADEIAQRKELQDVLAQLKKVEAKEKDKNVRQDLELIQRAFDLQFSRDDYQFDHSVQFLNASHAVYVGLHTLLDDHVPPERRQAAVLRLRKYAGVEPGFKPFTDLLEQRTIEQMAKPGIVYPTTVELEAELAHDKSYVDGIGALFAKYKLTGWREPFARLQEQLADYDAWARATIMPKARSGFQMTPEEYSFSLQRYGVDLPPAQLAAQAHADFTACQAEMAPLAAEVAKQHGWPSSNYRDVIRQLKRTQISGDAVLPFYKARLRAIEEIVKARALVTLPDRPLTVRYVSAAETAQEQASPHSSPPFFHNTGQTGEFVLPLNPTTPTGSPLNGFNDFTYDAVAWPMTAHEARPGNALQFDAMVQHGVSMAREMFAYNPANLDRWGLYSEWMVEPYEPADGQLITHQLRLLHAAGAFLDSELQSGKITPDDAIKVLVNDVALSPALAAEEVERLTFRAPGQANSYFYGYTTLLQLRKDTEAALGPQFDARKFHDFLLAEGPLPPDMLRKAVMEDFVPAQKKGR